ncbi:MAG: RagB/SusD family nutrient uptake outer membrane protein [Bacteroides sp.]|uniref:RagB/SusD family nutrient uptake outer membrane protein n=1 Tax=Bacteroides sp. TaxID=29523 RepID=UPI002FCA24E6
MKQIKITILSVVGLLSLGSCSDFLERYPQDEMNDQSYFTREIDLKYYMNGMYNDHLIRKTNNERWNVLNSGDKANDDYITSGPDGSLMRHSSSGLAGETSKTWNEAYDYIRKANYFLENAYKVKEMTNIGKHYLGEGYYCRAAKYFDLLTVFGGVPYIDKVLNVDSKDLYKPRSTRKYIAERIIADLDSAIVNLQWKGEGEAKSGRINKETALVMKTRVGLYEGSWEYYHGRKGTKFSVAGSDGKTFLVKAAEAGEMLIAKHKGNLFKGSKGNEYFEYFNQKDYEKIPGAFFYKVFSRDLAVTHKWVGDFSAGNEFGFTKSAIDAYVMKDGKPIEVSTVKLDNETLNELCSKKDPRLGQTIWYPERGRIYDWFPLFEHAYKTSYPGLIQRQQREPSYTGYRTWKGACFDYAETNNGEVDELIIRYEEGLLNFAEAKAILGTITQSDLDQSINYIRARVEMEGMKLAEVNSWSINYSKQNGYDPAETNIVNEIRRERRIELIIEGLRAMDIKRWALYDDVFNGWKPVGAYAQEFLDYWNSPEKLTADKFEFPFNEVKLIVGNNMDVIGEYINPFYKNADFKANSGRGYYINPDRDYLNAIPNEEITLYKNKAGVILEQNPGWF